MSNYRRLISYIYAYEGGVKGKNIGFARIETRGSQCKITVSVKKVFVGGSDTGVYLLAGDREIFLGTIFIRGGSGEFRAVVSSGDVEHSGVTFDECFGLTVHDMENTWRSYTTIWEDAVAHAAEIDLPRSEPEKKEAAAVWQIEKAVREIAEEFPIKEERPQRDEQQTTDVPGTCIPSVEYKAELTSDEDEEEIKKITPAPVTPASEYGQAETISENVDLDNGEVDDSGEDSDRLSPRETDMPDQTILPQEQSEPSCGETELQINAEPSAGAVTETQPSVAPLSSSEPEPADTSFPVMEARTAAEPFLVQDPMAGDESYSTAEAQLSDRTDQPQESWESCQAILEPQNQPLEENQVTPAETPPIQELSEAESAAWASQTPETTYPNGAGGSTVCYRSDSAVLEAFRERDLEEPNDTQIWQRLSKEHTKILDFDYANGLEILTIKPRDIGLLPRENWTYGNNSFLLHGYYNFRYLIIARLNNPYGTARYLLGVPGHYFINERYMAAMFGFPNFVLSKNQPKDDERFGYWYTDIRLDSVSTNQ